MVFFIDNFYEYGQIIYRQIEGCKYKLYYRWRINLLNKKTANKKIIIITKKNKQKINDVKVKKIKIKFILRMPKIFFFSSIEIFL